MSWLRRILLVAVLLALACGAVAVRTVLLDAGARRDRAAAQLADARERRASTIDQLDSTRDERDATAADAADTEAARQAVLEQVAAMLHETGNVSTQVEALAARVDQRSERLENLRTQLSAVTAQAEGLRGCLQGVSTATGATRRGDTAGAVSALQAVAALCRSAHSSLGEVDPGVRFPYDFPDPFVTVAGSTYYAYATNSTGGHVQLLRSPDLQSWTFVGSALRDVPAWAVPGATWAPAVVARPGGWRLYYAVREATSQRQCISVASSSSPTGPFVDKSTAPLVCPQEHGGAIDPSPFVAPGGELHLLWKGEGETSGGRATIQVQPLSTDGLRTTGPPTVLLQQDQGWEGRTIEAPSMIATSEGLVLLYSANRWDSRSYAVGAARCDGPAGPCHKVGKVLGSFGPMTGPGGAEAFRDRNGQARVVFHAWQGDDVGYPESRYLHIGTLSTAGGEVTITGE